MARSGRPGDARACWYTGEASNTFSGSRFTARPRPAAFGWASNSRACSRVTSSGETPAGKERVSVAALDIGAELAVEGHDRLAVLRMVAERARQRQQLQGHVQRHVLRLHALEQRGVLRLLFVLGTAALDIGSEAADLEIHRLAVRDRGPAAPRSGSALSSIFSAGIERQFVGRRLVGNARPAVALFEERPVAADADEDLRLGPSGWPIRMRHTSRASISPDLVVTSCFRP